METEFVSVKEPRSDDSVTDRLRFLMALCLVALGAAAFAIAFRSSLTLWYRMALGAGNVVEAIARLPWWMRVGLPAVGGAVAGLIARLRATPVQGVSNVMEAVALGNVQLSLRTTVSRVLSSWSAIATGMSIGREGPLIEFGGSLGAALGRATATSLDRTRVLVAAGTAAGFAAAYNTPFAAVLFVFETIVGIAAPEALLPTVAATVIATTLTRAVVGAGPIYGQRSFGPESTAAMLSFGALGVLAAFAAFGFKRVLAFLEQWFEHHPVQQPLRATMGGLVVGLIAVLLPEVAGNGFEPLNAILDQRMLLERRRVVARRQGVRNQRLGRLRRSRRHLHAYAADRRGAWLVVGTTRWPAADLDVVAERRQLCAGRDGGRHGGEHSRPAHRSGVGVRTVRRLCHRLAAASRDGRRDDGVERPWQ